jgi:NAD(P)-dependent dehydrogenase (short-subunit alcohol dehydrogenase family)
VTHVAVIARQDELGEAIERELTERGARVSVVVDRIEADAHERVDVSAALHDLDRRDPLDAIVIAHLFPPAAPAVFATMPVAAWDADGERPVREALVTLRVAHEVLRARGGRVVVICSPIGMSGLAGYAAACMAAEAVRVLTKSAARRWGQDGIAVHPVAAAHSLFVVDGPARLTDQPAVIDDTDPACRAAEVVAWALEPGGALVSGTTLVADGGALMLP